jgi:hypothetical protein
MIVVRIGPLTSLFEGISAAVGAGMVLGSFAVGAWGLLEQRSIEGLETHVLHGGYAGGMVATVSILADVIFRYAF